MKGEKMKHIKVLTLLILLLQGCDPFVNEFGNINNTVMYQASEIPDSSDIYNGDPIKVLTWNIRFGSGRFPFFGDSCGEEVLVEQNTVNTIMQKIADTLNMINADIVLLQEVDVSSKRTNYLDQVQYLLDNTYYNYACYASVWEADFVPNNGIGKMNMGNAILSKYELADAERIQLQLRTDQEDLVQYFYLRRNILKVKLPSLSHNGRDFFALNIHATAFATDNTKKKQIEQYLDLLSEIVGNDGDFVSGGDLNSVPPGSITDFCESDKCKDEVCDGDFKNNEAYQGTYFEHFDGEPDILRPFYDLYSSAISITDGSALLPENHTHAPSTSMLNDSTYTKYDRKLDYLFTNGLWQQGSGQTHQASWELSDHMPVSGIYIPTSGGE
jgi:endonuclease/exonuclease/phosphatase family metal-dependent hydrolase